MGEKIEYIGINQFVKFTNTEKFALLSQGLSDFLTNVGVYSNINGYPYFTTNGKLEKFNDYLIKFGEGIMGDPFCIDTRNNENVVGYNLRDNSIDMINTSLEKYIECLYTIYFFTNEYESKKKLGAYYENHKKYAEELKEMLILVEPKSMEYPIWGGLIEEMDLGVI